MHQHRILIVDDSSTQREALKALVERLGHIAMLAENGEEGVKIAIDREPDLILMDVVMPKVNGYQATRTLSKDPATALIPIVMVTSKDQPVDEVWGRRQGAKAYVTKPVDEAHLVKLIETLVHQVSDLKRSLTERTQSKKS